MEELYRIHKIKGFLTNEHKLEIKSVFIRYCKSFEFATKSEAIKSLIDSETINRKVDDTYDTQLMRFYYSRSDQRSTPLTGFVEFLDTM